MRGEDDDAVFFPWKTHDEVVHLHGTGRRVGGEGVLFELIAAKLVFQEGFGFGVTGTTDPARADGDKLAGVIEGALAVKLRQALRALRVSDRKCRGKHERGKDEESSHAAALAARRLRVAGWTIQETPMPSR